MENTWKGYQDAHGVHEPPQSTNPALPFPTTDARAGKARFQDLKPSYPDIQADYDAMSRTWKGVDANSKSDLVASTFQSGAEEIRQ